MLYKFTTDYSVRTHWGGDQAPPPDYTDSSKYYRAGDVVDGVVTTTFDFGNPSNDAPILQIVDVASNGSKVVFDIPFSVLMATSFAEMPIGSQPINVSANVVCTKGGALHPTKHPPVSKSPVTPMSLLSKVSGGHTIIAASVIIGVVIGAGLMLVFRSSK